MLKTAPIFRCLVLVLLISGPLAAQNVLTGTWSGWLTQPDDHFALSNLYSFGLTLTGDQPTTSRSHIAIDSLSFYGVMESYAFIKDQQVFVHETRITEQHIEWGYWYLKEYTLTYHPEDDTLRGRWKAAGRERGEIVLFRQSRFSHEL